MTPNNKIILGIDPGSNLLGYAFIQLIQSRKPKIIRMGALDMRSIDKHSDKLSFIYKELSKLIHLYAPSEAAIEAPFYSKNVQSMLKLGRAQGAAMLAVSNAGIQIAEYSPKSVKKAVTGNGNAAKEQVARMFPNIIEGEIDQKVLDATDALGVAYCHYIQSKGLGPNKKKHNDWSGFLKENPGRKAKL